MKPGVISRMWGLTCGRCHHTVVASREQERRRFEQYLTNTGWINKGFPEGQVCPICVKAETDALVRLSAAASEVHDDAPDATLFVEAKP